MFMLCTWDKNAKDYYEVVDGDNDDDNDDKIKGS